MTHYTSYLLSRAGTIIDLLCTISGWGSGLFVLVMSASMIIEVIMRLVFNKPTIWSLEVTSLSLLLSGFLAIPYVMKEGRHIRVDILLGGLSKKAKMSLETLTLLAVIVFSAILLWHGQKMLVESIRLHELSSGRFSFPMWIPRSVIPLGTFLLILQVLKIQFNHINLLRNGQATDDLPIRGMSLQNPLILIPLYIAVIIVGILLLKVNPILSMLVLLFAFFFGGVPVAFTLGLTGCILLFYLYGPEKGLVQASLKAYSSLDSFTLTAIPLFVFSSAVLSEGKMGKKLYDLATVWMGNLPGGLAIASVVACAFFGAVCGSTVAGAAAIGLVAIPEMVSRGYDKRLAYGTVAAAGNLAAMIPPSLSMILFGSLTEVSVGKLFIGGIIPGILQTILLSLTVVWHCRGGRRYTPYPASSWKQKAFSLKDGFWVFMAPVIVIGGIYGGIFTPTEAAGVLVLYSFLVCIFVLRTLRWQNVKNAIITTVNTSGFLLMIIVGAMIFGHVLTYLHMPDIIMATINEAQLNRWVVLIAIQVLMLILGCFMEAVSILYLVVPVAFPVIVNLGFDPIWFGVLFTANMEVGTITPPVGMNLYTIQGITQDKLSEVIRGTLLFIFVLIFALALLTAFPPLITWLPSKMGG